MHVVVLDHVPIVVSLAIFLSLGTSQKHDSENLSASRRAWESGRSSLQPFWQKLNTSPIEYQTLSRQKILKIRVFEPESAKTG